MTKPNWDPLEVWGEDKHLSEVGVAALADGQGELLPAEAAHHADTCEHCAARVGAAVFLSLVTDEDMNAVAAVSAETLKKAATNSTPAESAPVSSPGFRLPAPALTAALLVVVLGTMPQAISLGATAGRNPAELIEMMTTVIKGLVLLFRGVTEQDTVFASLAWSITALTLVSVGAVVIRQAPSNVSEGPMGDTNAS